MTRLQQRRLATAIKRLREAGLDDTPGHLIDRLRHAFMTGNYSAQGAETLHARSWASIILANKDRKACDRARDAIGLLWATMEHDDD